jgi:hypothetical protein
MTAHSPWDTSGEIWRYEKKPNYRPSPIMTLIILTPTGLTMTSLVLTRNLYLISCTESVSDYELQDWFEFKIPKTKIWRLYLNAFGSADDFNIKPAAKIVWLGGKPSVEYFTKSKRKLLDMMSLTFHDKKESFYSNKQTRRRMVSSNTC